MSLTPVFDAVLADSEPDLFLAGSIFPRPGLDSFEAALIRAGHPRFARGGLIPKPQTVRLAHMAGTVPFAYRDPRDNAA
jgi:hypothetical protein